ncbi:MAG: hypothetical protein R3F37_16545 [Candidatus Competibacteraceae bacterium]
MPRILVVVIIATMVSGCAYQVTHSGYQIRSAIPAPQGFYPCLLGLPGSGPCAG